MPVHGLGGSPGGEGLRELCVAVPTNYVALSRKDATVLLDS